MPCTPEAIEVFHENGILFGLARPPVLRGGDLGSRDDSNSLRMSWTREEVDLKLEHNDQHSQESIRNCGEVWHAGNYVLGRTSLIPEGCRSYNGSGSSLIFFVLDFLFGVCVDR